MVPAAVLARSAFDIVVAATPLVGRERELGDLSERLRRGDARLVTLTGPGGSGKTRLALALAASAPTNLGVSACFVDLSQLADSDLVIPTTAQALGVSEVAGRPLLDVLQQVLREQCLLLVLDNFEHVLDAAIHISSLLEMCPNLFVLATSREPLHLQWESEFPVAPLVLPVLTDPVNLDAVAQSPAVRLFVQRAQAVRPEFALTEGNATAVATICIAVDGLPLAIEFGAAWTRIFEPRALLGRLQSCLSRHGLSAPHAPSRHRTLTAAISWSYDLLGDLERAVFRRLGIFAGGCTLEAAEVLTEASSTLNVLFALVDKSLVECTQTTDGEPRFRMLETVRSFALDQLAMSGELEDTRRHHAAYFLALAEEGRPELIGPRARLWLDRLEREHDNLRAAWRWAVDTDDTDLQLRLAASVWEFRWMRGHLSEGRLALETALTNNTKPSRSRAIALHGAGILTSMNGNYERSLRRFAASVEGFRQLDDSRGLGRALVDAGITSLIIGARDRGETLLDQGLTVGRNVGDDFVIGYAHLGFGHLAFASGDFSHALSVLEKAVAAGRQVESPRLVAHGLANLVMALSELEEGARATALADECLSQMVGLGDMFGMLWALIGLACGASIQGRLDRAARLFGASEALRATTAVALFPYLSAHRDRRVAATREQMGDAAFDAAWAAGSALAVEDAIAFARETDDRGAQAAGRKQRGAVSAQASRRLTRREREVATWIGRGRTSREIAELLVISKRTADAHAEHIRSKLELGSRTEIATWAAEQGLLGDKS